jgi:hypothetical protein
MYQSDSPIRYGGAAAANMRVIMPLKGWCERKGMVVARARDERWCSDGEMWEIG